MKTIFYIIFVLNVVVKLFATTYYVSPNGSNIYPYTTWQTSATNIQTAINAAEQSGLVIVTDGVYYISTQITIDNSITVTSVNGAESTIIDGTGITQCVYMSNDSYLKGFTIRNGYINSDIINPQKGAGVYCDNASIYDCVISNNSVISANGYAIGGGIYCLNSSINNCTIAKNRATDNFNGGCSGGGIYCVSSKINNCVIDGNGIGGVWGDDGGGGIKLVDSEICNSLIINNGATCGGGIWASGAKIINCTIVHNTASESAGGLYLNSKNEVANSIIFFNTAPVNENYYGDKNYFNSCCLSPYLPNNPWFIPEFVDINNDNYRLSSTTFCRNLGNNDYATGYEDLDGKPRILKNIVDIGAYEYGDIEEINLNTIDILKLKLKLNRKKANKDNLFCKLTFDITENTQAFTNLKYQIKIGNYIISSISNEFSYVKINTSQTNLKFKTDKKNNLKKLIKIKILKKGTKVKTICKIKKADLADVFAEYGVTNITTANTGNTIEIPFQATLGPWEIKQMNISVIYRSVKDKVGNGKKLNK